MADFHVLTGARGEVDFPGIRRIGFSDLGGALAAAGATSGVSPRISFSLA